MRRTRRRRADEPDGREQGETAKETAGERTLAGEAVRLQELLGNASATEVLARSPLQRDTAGTEAAPAKSGEKEEPKGVVYTITMSDIGTFELLSWSWGTTSGGGAGESGGGPGKHKVRDISASTHANKHTAKVMQYAASGQHIATVELRTSKGGQAFAIKLKDVVVNSYQTGSGDPPVDTFGLAFEEVEYEFSEEKK